MEKKNKNENGKNGGGPAEGSNKVLWWILGGCLALLIIFGLVLGGIAYWSYKKVKREVKKNQPNFEKLQTEAGEFQKQAERSAGQTPPDVSSGENYSGEPVPVLPENSERQMGYVKKVYAKGGANYLDIDYIQWFMGDAAEKAMREDGECPKTGECIVLDDYYIRNVNLLVRTFEITPETKIIMQTYNSENTGIVNNNQSITLAQFKNIFSGSSQTHLKDVPYIIEIQNQKIVKITEQYVP